MFCPIAVGGYYSAHNCLAQAPPQPDTPPLPTADRRALITRTLCLYGVGPPPYASNGAYHDRAVPAAQDMESKIPPVCSCTGSFQLQAVVLAEGVLELGHAVDGTEFMARWGCADPPRAHSTGLTGLARSSGISVAWYFAYWGLW